MSPRRPPVVDRQRLQALAERARAAVDELRARPKPTAPTAPALPTLPTLKLPERPTVPTLPELPARPTDPRVLALQQRRRRQRIAVGLVVLALLLLALLLRDCNACAPEVQVVYVEGEAPTCPDVPECGPAKPKPKPKPTKPRKKPTGAARADARDDLVVTTRANPDWLAALRLQVTARSLDLARCFNGMEKPGALRWTTTIVPASGATTDSELEQILRSVPLTTAQQACVLNALTQRPFRLDSRDAVGTRVSLILEF